MVLGLMADILYVDVKVNWQRAPGMIRLNSAQQQ